MALLFIFVITSVCSAQECGSTADVIWQPTSVSLNLGKTYEIVVADVLGSGAVQGTDLHNDGWVLNSTVYASEEDLYKDFHAGKITYAQMVTHLKSTFIVVGHRIKFSTKTRNNWQPYLDWSASKNMTGYSSTSAVDFICGFAKVNTAFMKGVTGQEGVSLMRSWLTGNETILATVYIPNAQIEVYNKFLADFSNNPSGFSLYKTYITPKGDTTKIYKRL